MIGNEEVEALMREMIERHIGLDLSAKILWQLRIFMECKDSEKYLASKGASDELLECHVNTERARQQLDHYLTEAGMEDFIFNS